MGEQDGYSHIRHVRTANYIFSKVGCSQMFLKLGLNYFGNILLTNISQKWVELLQKDFGDSLTNVSQDDQIVSFDDLLSFDELNDQKVAA